MYYLCMSNAAIIESLTTLDHEEIAETATDHFDNYGAFCPCSICKAAGLLPVAPYWQTAQANDADDISF